MAPDFEVTCGCKGIRTCLICEKEKSDKFVKSVNESKVTLQYTYCPHCNLCWPSDAADESEPIYLEKLNVIEGFIYIEEETSLISEIDRITWMPSQSGRRKQDFGPKVNFKKKKGKIGNFKGFPRFSENLIKRLHLDEELADFFPVELCHLDYSPDRGSAIEAHIDDSWIWGERLVTINLASAAVLNLTPTNLQNCSCREFKSYTFPNPQITKKCNHGSHKVLAVTDTPSTAPGLSVDVRTACGMARIRGSDYKYEIQVSLPPRSLFVLAGCGRHNWFHEIKRQSITQRRIAMTFRELSINFLEGGEEKELGDELLEIGRQFYELEL